MRTCGVLVAIAAAMLGVACGPPPSNCCGRRTTVARSVNYTGTIPLPDGGTPTQVKVNVSAAGNTTITFVNDGVEIVQGFDSVVLTP